MKHIKSYKLFEFNDNIDEKINILNDIFLDIKDYTGKPLKITKVSLSGDFTYKVNIEIDPSNINGEYNKIMGLINHDRLDSYGFKITQKTTELNSIILYIREINI